MINSYILKILNSYIRFSILRFSILPRRPIKKPAVEAGFGIKNLTIDYLLMISSLLGPVDTIDTCTPHSFSMKRT